MGSFITIAECRGFGVRVPEDSYFSFFNSPYPAHRLVSAIDIYFQSHEALLPVDEGLIVDIDEFECPRYRSDGSKFDYVIVVGLGGGTALKMLHVKPKVRVGDRVYLGDYLGDLIVSGYFFPWSDLHMHVEFRPISDAYRALGAYELNLKPLLNLIGEPKFSGEFIVYDVFDHYIWLKPVKNVSGTSGLCLSVNGKLAYVDGGVPHYGYGALLNLEASVNCRVEYPWNGVVGFVRRTGRSFSIFDANCKVTVNGVEVRGVGSYVNNALLKVVMLSSLDFKCGDIVNLHFEFDSNVKPTWPFKFRF